MLVLSHGFRGEGMHKYGALCYSRSWLGIIAGRGYRNVTMTVIVMLA